MTMKKYILLLTATFYTLVLVAHPTENKSEDPQLVVNELVAQLQLTHQKYAKQKESVYLSFHQVSQQLVSDKVYGMNNTEIIKLLLQKEKLQNQLKNLEYAEVAEISKIRYLKGIAIIKILYEKILALDHHFASIATFNEINKISNPNHYPEFAGIKDIIKQSGNKKVGLELTKILGDNVYANIAATLVGLFNSDAPKEQKQAELNKVDCIIDFTLRMHQDLNTIWFETSFLSKSNDKMKEDIEQLFVDYTKPINYITPLAQCRKADDWDTINEKLKLYLEEMDKYLNDNSQQFKVHKMQVNLEFTIDRLLQFITQYNAFIDQGGKFYEKFKIILDSYENANQCQSSLPPEYKKLKSDIDVAIDKFNTAYKPVEINGSKMKEILYGINEYE